MGYEIDFKPTKEFVEEKLKKLIQYKPKNNELPYIKTDILIYCLGEADDTRRVMNRISFNLRYMYDLIRYDEIQYAINRFEENGTIWYCGWEYSKDDCDWDLDELVERNTKTLTLLKQVVETPNYFDNGERFYDKINEIDEHLDGFEEICRDIAIYEIMNMMREFQEKDDLEYLIDNDSKIYAGSDMTNDETDTDTDDMDDACDVDDEEEPCKPSDLSDCECEGHDDTLKYTRVATTDKDSYCGQGTTCTCSEKNKQYAEHTDCGCNGLKYNKKVEIQ